MNYKDYVRKMDARQSELAWKDEPLTDSEKLEYILCSIKPYSKWWRWGFVSALKRAIKVMREKEK